MNKAYKAKYLRQREINKHLAWGFIVSLLLTILFAYLTYEQADLICPVVDCTTAVNTLSVSTGVNYSPSDKTVAVMNANVGVNAKIHAYFGDNWMAWAELIAMESSFNPGAINPTSGAIGLFQRYPAHTLTDECPDLEIQCQFRNGERYVIERYGNIDNALSFWNARGWY